MPVVTSQGLVGRVDAVIATAARIQLISDADSVVNVKLNNAKVDAQTNGSITGEVSLVQVPQGVEVLPGEVLITSGLGGTYPANIFVGQVDHLLSQLPDCSIDLRLFVKLAFPALERGLFD